MIPSAAALHRGKHFDMLLEHQFAFLKREHEQKLIIHQKFEDAIRRDFEQTKILSRKKFSIPTDESFKRGNEKSRSKVSSNNRIENQIDEKYPRFYRQCFKGQRLPPIVKLNRRKRINNDINWIANRQSRSIQKENDEQTFTLLNEESPKISLPDITHVQEKMQSFMETLPIHKGVQRGYDHFAPSSLYSQRLPVAMR